nr:TonB-dependent receptor [Acidobacteriota bacterium]
TLDGTVINDALNNTPGSAQGLLVGVETVKEFRVLTTNYSAEFGRATGGIFIAVTKSGTNQFHGSGFEFLRNDALDAANFFDNAGGLGKGPFRRNQFGFTVGGPLMLPHFGEGGHAVGYNGKNKTFFFGSYEGLRETKAITTTSIVPDNNARLGRLPGTTPFTVDARSLPIIDLFPRPNGGLALDANGNQTGAAFFSGTTNRVSNDDFFTVKVDHTFSNSNSMFVRYLYDNSDQVLPRNFPEFPNLALNKKQVLTIEERAIISSTIVNEARFGFNRSTPQEVVPKTSRTLALIAGKDLGEITVGGLTAVGTDRTNPKSFFLSNYQFTDNLSVARGRHSLRMGVSFDRFVYDGDSESRSRGQLRFRNLSDLLRFRVQDLQGASNTSDFVRNYRQNLFGVYVQDDFKFNKRLMLNLGLRYEAVTTPHEINGKVSNLRNITDPTMTIGPPLFKPTRMNFAPRFGFAYDLFGDGKTALRGGFGIYYDQPLFSIYRNPIFRGLPFVNRGTIPGSQVTTLPVDSSRFIGSDPTTEIFQFKLRPAYVMQYNLNVQRQISSDTMVSIAYVGSRGVNLFGQGDVNTAIPTILPDGTQFFPANAPRRNPNFGQARQIFQGFNSWYNSVNVSAVKRFAQGLQFQVSYTFGRSLDERSGTSGRQEFDVGQARAFDPYNRKLDKGRSNFDVRHSFVANATYDLPFGKGKKGIEGLLASGWQLNTIVTLSSGVPFSVFVSGDPDRDGTDDNAARPNLVTNANLVPAGGRTPNLWFNPAAFVPAPVGFRGNAGRNILDGPDYRTVDFSVVKVFRIDEKRSLQFRTEIFNLFNRANFDVPGNSEDGEQVFTFTAPNTFALTPGVGQIFRTVGDSREIQFGLKFIF